MSHVGKEVLIKLMVLATSSFPIMCFKFLNSLGSQIEAQIAKFWRGKKKLGKQNLLEKLKI